MKQAKFACSPLGKAFEKNPRKTGWCSILS